MIHRKRPRENELTLKTIKILKTINFTSEPQVSWPSTKQLTDQYWSMARGLWTAGLHCTG